MLADHARTLDPFRKAAEELIEALPLAEFNPHVSAITPPQGVIRSAGCLPDLVHTQGQPCMIAGVAPATQQPRIRYGRHLDESGGGWGYRPVSVTGDGVTYSPQLLDQ